MLLSLHSRSLCRGKSLHVARRSFYFSRIARSKKAALETVEQAVSYRGFWGALRTFPKRRPFSTNLLLSTAMIISADINVQAMEGSRDGKRLLFCGVFGFFNGMLFWGFYITICSRICPGAIVFANRTWAEKLRDRAGQIEVLKQALVDVLVFTPIVYFPFFYSSKALIHEGTPDIFSATLAGLAKYKSTFIEDNSAQIAIWFPGDLLVLTVPAWLRLPTSYGIGFCWTNLLLIFRGGKDKAETTSCGSEA